MEGASVELVSWLGVVDGVIDDEVGSAGVVIIVLDEVGVSSGVLVVNVCVYVYVIQEQAELTA